MINLLKTSTRILECLSESEQFRPKILAEERKSGLRDLHNSILFCEERAQAKEETQWDTDATAETKIEAQWETEATSKAEVKRETKGEVEAKEKPEAKEVKQGK